MDKIRRRDFLKCVVKPRDFYIKYNYFINEVFADKNEAKEKFKVM